MRFASLPIANRVVLCLALAAAASLPSRQGLAQDEQLATLPKLLQQLDSGNVDDRAQAANMIAELGPAAAKAIPALVDRLSDDAVTTDGVFVGQSYVLALAAIGKAAVPTLVKQLPSNNEYRFAAATESLYRIGPDASPAVEFIVPKLDDASGTRLWGYVHILEGIGPAAKPAVPWLRSRLKTERNSKDIDSFQLQIVMCRALASIGPEALPATDILVEIVEDHEAPGSIIGHAALALGAIGPFEDPRIVLAIAKSMEVNQFSVRERALQALGRLGPAAEPALPILKTYWEAKSFNAEIELALCMWKVTGDPGPSAERLAKLADKFNTELEAIVALGKMGPAAESQVDLLIGKLKSADGDVVYEACGALAEIGPAAQKAIPEIKAQTNNADEFVAQGAQRALARLNASQAP